MQSIFTFRRIFTLVILSCAFLSLAAQKEEGVKKKKKKEFDAGNAVLISPIYTAQFPFGNMRDRYGFNSLFGMQISYKTKKNWMFGVEGSFLFGTTVRENYILDNISTPTGQHIGQNNDLIRPKLQEMGSNLKFTFGKIVPLSEKYPDAGLLFLTGFGFLSHQIAINVKATSLPQLDKTYRKGYDRLANGPVISQFIGGIFLARRKFVSAYAGIQFDLGITQGRRYDFYSHAQLHDKRLDMFLGIKVGWIIPVFTTSSSKEYYYY
jgi:hypothetical protein